MDEKTVKVEIPIRTYVQLALALLIGLVIVKLAPVFLLFFISLLVAVTLTSLERFLMKRGWTKALADSVLILGLLGIITIIVYFVIPTALSQLKAVLFQLPELKNDISKIAPKPIHKSALRLIAGSPESTEKLWGYAASMANQTLTGVFQMGVMLIVAIYMLIDGKKAYNWVLAFFSDGTREQIDNTAKEIGPIVEAYIIGQATTSTIAAIWVFSTAYFLGVPAAVTLGVLAAFFDILPSIGIVLNLCLSGLLALTVGTHAAFIMIASLITYSALENYLLIPHIYGKRMKLSPLVVLLSIIISGILAGVPGMISILPIVAAYGPIERHWLKRKSASMRETVQEHERMTENKDPDHLSH